MDFRNARSRRDHDERSVTAFQREVYRVVSEIPAGRVATYLGVAEALGCGSARAVGQALRRNPYAPEVPCHRVISSDMSLGGFRGRQSGAAIDKKIRMLADEGVVFVDGRLAEPLRLYRPRRHAGRT